MFMRCIYVQAATDYVGNPEVKRNFRPPSRSRKQRKPMAEWQYHLYELVRFSIHSAQCTLFEI